METRRFLEAATIARTGGVVLTEKGSRLWEFWVSDKYTVQIAEDRLTCSCEYASLYGVKKPLPCKHIIACFIQISRVWGPIIRERWEDPVHKTVDFYNELNDEQKASFIKEVGL